MTYGNKAEGLTGWAEKEQEVDKPHRLTSVKIACDGITDCRN